MNDDEPCDRRADAVVFNCSDAAECPQIAAMLADEIAARFGPRDEAPLSIAARDSHGALIAGLNGVSHWRWLYVRHFFVARDWRGQGLGRRLMTEAERAARRRGCIGVYLDTFDEGAAQFYEQLGFARRGRIDDFPPGAARIYMSKEL